MHRKKILYKFRVNTFIFHFPFFIFVLSVIGCSSLQLDLAALPENAGPDFHIINGVTLPQSDTSGDCAAEALSAMYSFLGKPSSPGEIRNGFIRKSGKGTPSIELLLSARRAGFDARQEAGAIESLNAHINAGRPVIVMLEINTLAADKMPAIAGEDVFHFFVISGYSEKYRCAVIEWHDGRKTIGYDIMMKAWQKAGFFLLVCGV
ncbi:MAG: hypothetical protein HZA48_11210 [Planctomycetes bacterium]|nr:hypothetical protein [Planctomycetota bacterium]